MTIAGYRTALCGEDDPSSCRDCRGWSPSDVRSAQANAAAAPAKAKAAADASGQVGDIAWDSWGGAQATGTGTARYGAGSYGTCPAWMAAHPGKDCNLRVPIVAYRLTNCGGHQGYSAVEWYFPQVGQTRDLNQPSYGLPSYDICTSGC